MFCSSATAVKKDRDQGKWIGAAKYEKRKPDMKSKIFISYSRKDLEAVRRLRDEIHSRTGILPWMDLSGIETGTQFADVIAKAIDDCELLVFVISRHSVKSEWTEREVLYAQDAGKKIYPVVIDDVELTGKIKFLLINIDRVDIRDGVQYEKLFLDLSAFCGARAYGKAPSQNAVSPQFPPRYKAREYDRGFSHFLEKHKDLLIGLLVILLVIVFVGIPVYVITSRLMAQ